jgi:hypothetical protein
MDRQTNCGLVWMYGAKKTTKNRTLIDEKKLTSPKFLSPSGRVLPNGNIPFFYCSDLLNNPSKWCNREWIKKGKLSTGRFQNRIFRLTEKKLFRFRCDFGASWLDTYFSLVERIFFILNAWICAEMCRHNYRIVKKPITHRYKSILRKILAQCCHMATSGRKGLTLT